MFKNGSDTYDWLENWNYYNDIWITEKTCVKNKDLLTNFDLDQIDIYKIAIHKYKKIRPDIHLWIRDDAYAMNDIPLGSDSKALMLENKAKVGDMLPFWKIYDKLRTDDNYLQQELNKMNRKKKLKKLL